MARLTDFHRQHCAAPVGPSTPSMSLRRPVLAARRSLARLERTASPSTESKAGALALQLAETEPLQAKAGSGEGGGA
jgi:hypothetical protein